MSLSSTLIEIKKLKPLAEEDVNSGPTTTLAGRRGRKTQAIEQLKVLKRDYKRDLLQSALFIIVTGANKDQFTNEAVSNYGCFSSDPESFYKDLASRVSPALYLGKESSSNVFDVLGRYLEDKAMELDIIEMPQIIFKQPYAQSIKDNNAFVALVKRVINEQVGAEIVGIQAIASLVDEAIERDHAKRLTPIILNTSDDQLILSLSSNLQRLTSRVFIVAAGKTTKAIKSLDNVVVLKDTDTEAVKETLESISKNAKK